MNVLISGAGIAGPALAHWLLRHGGFEITLVESAPRLRTGGYVIDFWGAGFDIAEQMGILPALRDTGYQVQEIRMMDREGRRAGGFSANAIRRAAGGRWLTLSRAELASAIYRSIEGRVEVLFGESITSLEQRSERVEVRFERAPTRTFDLVIGADGVHSRVRELAFAEQLQPPGRSDPVPLHLQPPLCRRARRPGGAEGVSPAPLRRRRVGMPADPRPTGSDRVLLLRPRQPDPHGGMVARPHRLARRRCVCSLVPRRPGIGAGDDRRVRPGGRAEAGARQAGARLCPLPPAPGEFMARKQHSAIRFSDNFAPRSKLSVFLKNHLSSALGLPFAAELLFRPLMKDRIALPSY